jgi:hypothetical protein
MEKLPASVSPRLITRRLEDVASADSRLSGIRVERRPIPAAAPRQDPRQAGGTRPLDLLDPHGKIGPIVAKSNFLSLDDDAEVYINGIPAATATGYTSDYQMLPMSAAANATLKPTGDVMAVHCHQVSGGQYVDAGIVKREVSGK